MGGLGIMGAALLSVFGLGSLYTILYVQYNVALSAGAATAASVWSDPVIEMLESTAFLLLVAAFAALGFADDWSKARGTGGLKARQKFAWQLILTVAFLVLLSYIAVHAPTAFRFEFDTVQQWKGTLAALFFLLIFLVGTCNAVNLTDGIDGLAAGLMVIAGVTLAFCIRNSGPLFDASWLSIALAGSCLAFLAFNRFPARVFMGDTGSLALGAALGMCAVLGRAVFLLPFIGFIFYIEMFSVMTQVAWFQYTKRKSGEGKRLFRRAPLHHHYELGGCTEWRVVITFWLVNLITSAIGLALWQLGIIPRWP
jgi:phospho-N-acetylmuramoyl-pentapeptide-transferase